MFTTYCRQCGSKNQNDSFKPKFCANCGESFLDDNTRLVSKEISKNVRKTSIKSAIINKDLEDDDSQQDIDPDTLNVSENDFQVEITDVKINRQKIKNLISSNAPPIPIPKVKLPKNYNKKVLEDFKKEAGTSRKN